MKILLAGATGLVGNQVLSLGLDQGHEVTTVGRRPTGRASSEIVSSFTELPHLPPANVAICALGTTIRQAGSKDAFRAVDHDAVMSFASAAKTAGIEHSASGVGAAADTSESGEQATAGGGGAMAVQDVDVDGIYAKKRHLLPTWYCILKEQHWLYQDKLRTAVGKHQRLTRSRFC